MQQKSTSHLYRTHTRRWLRLIAIIGLVSLCDGYRLLQPVYAASPHRVFTGETIVYVNADASQLRLIQPDGSNDRLLWEVPGGATNKLTTVAWRPDAQQIAFTSSHEATCSEYGADIYLINPDGSNLRRLTNAPMCSELAGYVQGSASVQIENLRAGISQLLVYIEGAPTAKVVTVASGSTVLVAFPQVADLGAGVLQQVVVIDGSTRWFDAAVNVDVVAGQNAHAGTLTVSGAGFAAYGASYISWNPSGTKLAYQLGTGRLWQVGLDVPLLGEGGPLLNPQTNNAILATQPVWSPIDNRVLYERFDTSPFTISQTEVDSNSAGTALVDVILTSGIAWLTNAAGFVTASDDALLSHTDLYIYRYAGPSIVQLTQTTINQAAAEPAISADSGQIVYTWIEDLTVKPYISQLRIMNVDGSNDHLLVAGGRVANWSRVAPQNPAATATSQPTASPQPNVTATPKPAATITPDGGGQRVYLPAVSR